MNNGFKGALGSIIALIILGSFVVSCTGPELSIASVAGTITRLVIFGTIAVVALVALVVVLIIRHQRSKKGTGKTSAPTSAATPMGGTSTSERKKATALSERDAQAIATGRRNLVRLQTMAADIKDPEVRAAARKAIAPIEDILDQLKRSPKDISSQRQFFNYYMPTLGEVMKKFHGFELGNMVTDELKTQVLAHLADFEKAMVEQYESLFSNDRLDLSVEMESMTIALKRDGLLDESDFETVVGEGGVGERPIELKL